MTMIVTRLHHDSGLEQISGLHVGANRVFFAGGLHSPVMFCSSNLNDFLRLDVPGQSGLRDVAIRANGTGWAVGEYGQILITDSFGEEWLQYHVEEDDCLQSVTLGPDGNAWVFGENGFLAKVTDKGEVNRVAISRPTTLAAMAVAGSIAVIPGYEGSVVHVRGGVELGWFPTGTELALCDIVRTKSGALIVCGDGGFLARSMDGGMTWKQSEVVSEQAPSDSSQAKTQPGDLESLAILSDATIITVGAQGGIFTSTDDGLTFNAIDSGIDTHLRTVGALPDSQNNPGAIIAGDDATILWIGTEKSSPWAEREDILNRPRIFDDFFKAGPENFIAERLPGLARAAAERVESLIDGDAISKNLAHIERQAAIFDDLYGHPMPDTFTQLWRALASVPSRHVLSDFSLRCDVAPKTDDNIFLALIERNQHSYLGTDLRNAFSGVFDIGLFDNGDRYLLECGHRFLDTDGNWVDDDMHLVYRYDHEVQTYAGVVAKSLDAQTFLSALITAHSSRLVSPKVYRNALTSLRKQVNPSDRLALAQRDRDFEPYLADPQRNDVEFFEVRAMWIITLLKNDGVRTLEDLPHYFHQELNPELTSDELQARLEVIPEIPATAIYVLWRAYLFAEPHLNDALTIAATSPARLVRDCASLIAELVAGNRNALGTIADVPQWLAAFQALDLDPRGETLRSKVRQEELARVTERRAVISSAVLSADDAGLVDLAWADPSDPLVGSAIAQRLSEDSRHTAFASRLAGLAALEIAERPVAVELIAAELPPVYVPLLVGAVIRENGIEEFSLGEASAGELVEAFASTGRLGDRGIRALVDCLATATRFDHRRSRAVSALGATRDQAHSHAIAQLLDSVVIIDEVSAARGHPLVTACLSALKDLASADSIAALTKFAARQGESDSGRFTLLDEFRGATGLALAHVIDKSSTGDEIDQLPEEVLDNLFSVITEIADEVMIAEASLAVGALAAQMSPDDEAAVLNRLGETSPAIKRPLVLLAGAVALGMDRVPGRSLGQGPLAEQIAQVLYSSEPEPGRYISRAKIILNLADQRPDAVDPEAFATLLDYPQRFVRSGARALIERAGITVPPEHLMDRYTAEQLPDEELIVALSTPLIIGRDEVVRQIRKRNLFANRDYLIRLSTAILSRLPHNTDVLTAHDSRLLSECLLALTKWSEGFDDDTADLLVTVLMHPNPSVKPIAVRYAPTDRRFVSPMRALARETSPLSEAASTWLSGYQQEHP